VIERLNSLTHFPAYESIRQSSTRLGRPVTIAIAVQVHDGVVLASDSATTLTAGPGAVLNVYNNANKIFNLRKGLPIGGMTYGMGSIGSSSISTLAKDLRRRFSGDDKNYKDWHVDPENFTIEQIARRAREFLYDEMFLGLGANAPTASDFGFVVTGYSSGAQLSEVWLIEIKGGQCAAPNKIIDQGVTEIYAAGDPEAFSRIVIGHSQKLSDGLIKIGLDPSNLQAALAILRAEMAMPLVEAAMPIQDAIELAEFLVYATAMFTRFKRGAPIVGGPIESAAITKHEGFKWVHRKHYYSSALNPSEVH
jgi:hypothetical protein